MISIGIDPGLNHVAVALYCSITEHFESYLAEVPAQARTAESYVKAAERVSADTHRFWTTWYGSPHIVTIERMRVRRDFLQAADDVMYLAELTGALTMAAKEWASQVQLKAPEEWKGQVPKGVFERRLERRFPEEVAKVKVEHGHLAHNVLDAMGIALYGAGQ